jgi:hypothetical protein
MRVRTTARRLALVAAAVIASAAAGAVPCAGFGSETACCARRDPGISASVPRPCCEKIDSEHEPGLIPAASKSPGPAATPTAMLWKPAIHEPARALQALAVVPAHGSLPIANRSLRC